MEKLAVKKLGNIMAQYLGVKLNTNEAKELIMCQDWEIVKNGDEIWLDNDDEKLKLLDYILTNKNKNAKVCQYETCQDWEIFVSLPCGGQLSFCSISPLI